MTVPISHIQRCVAIHYGISLADMRSPRRSRRVSWPRILAMYLARRLTTSSFPVIGREFGKHHTTVIYAVDRAEAIMEKRPDLAADMRAFLAALSDNRPSRPSAFD